MHIKTLIQTVQTVSGSVDGKNWLPVRPQTAENTFLIPRIRAAWRVLIGQADAVEWHEPLSIPTPISIKKDRS